MAKVRVEMLGTSATPDRILHVGHIYLLDENEAESLLAEGSGPDGKPAAKLVNGGKAEKITKPDPGEDDKPDTDDTDEDA